jgi:thioredoxin-related protein
MDEEGAAQVKPFLQKHPMEYTVGLGNEALAKELNFDIENGLPVTVVFDRKGKEVKRFQGFLPEPELLAAVQAAL